MVRTRSPCCACATNGIAVTLPSKPMKSRRLTAAPSLRKEHRTDSDYLIERGARASPVMSALGQKQTFAAQKVMSALPPKGDMCGALGHVCFGPKADIAAATL